MTGTDSTQSWFGPGLDSEVDAALDAALDAAADHGPDSAQMLDSDPAAAQPRRLISARGNPFGRLYRAFLAARVALGLLLVVTQLAMAWLGTAAPSKTLYVALAYAALALLSWLVPRLQHGASAQSLARVSSPQWLASIGVDLIVFGLLHGFDRDAGVNYGALFVMPVLMAGVLTPRLMALATAAVAALVMLGVSGWTVLHGADAALRMTQAGLVGSGFFVVCLLASEMASRLAREERAARGSMEFARQQAQLNRLVIDEMREGVLVVDRRGRVRAANPAARALLSDQPPATLVRAAPFQLRGVPAWQPLVRAVEQAFTAGIWPETGRDINLQFASNLQRSLRLRMRFTRRRESHASEDLCVLFIEDNKLVQARSQQEKLAAMGRVSAGIAHEIRNPLAAIDQANALLAEQQAEEGADPRAQQLTRMVASNVLRLKRIVDDVMEVAPGGVPEVVPLDASQLVAETCLDWARTNELAPGPDDPLSCDVPMQPLVVGFDPEHLRRVLINLLDNALRHAVRGRGCVQVRLEADTEHQQWARLIVFSAGAPIPADVERHLFEPFFSTRSRGSGLGLYICRELCERYGARIDYRHCPDAQPPGNEFVLRLQRRNVAPLQSNLYASPS